MKEKVEEAKEFYGEIEELIEQNTIDSKSLTFSCPVHAIYVLKSR